MDETDHTPFRALSDYDSGVRVLAVLPIKIACRVTVPFQHAARGGWRGEGRITFFLFRCRFFNHEKYTKLRQWPNVGEKNSQMSTSFAASGVPPLDLHEGLRYVFSNQTRDSTDAFFGGCVGAECRQSRLAAAVVVAAQLSWKLRSSAWRAGCTRNPNPQEKP